MKNTDLIKNFCIDCIAEGESILKTKWSQTHMGDFVFINPTTYVDLERFQKWKADCNVLMNLLKDLSSPWSKTFSDNEGNTLSNAKSMLGALKSIKDTIDKGYLLRVEDLIFAEAFSNLIEQAEYLFGQSYDLAAGVIARAVLEERLRNMCDVLGIQFQKARPTLSDYNNELYKANYFDKLTFKNVEYLTAIGNSAAHNQTITHIDIKNLIDGVKSILLKYN
ncbi:MAG: DUF4145 domain-containing protein [Pedobacter sp.]|nr:MAG: DUF4145 domain-containing protein [Pedobacter sp.]